MRLLSFFASRQFRWPLAMTLCVAAMIVLVLTRAESGAPFGMAMLAALIAYDG